MSKIAAFVKDELNLVLTDGQVEVLEGFESGGYSEAVWQCGRRGGKSTLADAIVLYDAIARDFLRKHLLPGEPRVAAIVAQNLMRARRHITRLAGWVKGNPSLSGLLVGETADELTFSNGSVIAAFPCSARSVRGDAWSSCVLDELGHFVDTSEGDASGDRVYEAVSPSLAQFADAGWLISISTPRFRKGMFWTLVQRGQGGQFPHLHYVKKTSLQMNSRLSPTYLAKKELEDVDAYRREYLAEFTDAGAFLGNLDVLACVRRGEGILPPTEGVHYRCAIDPAFERDNFALAIAHRERDNSIIDGVWVWRDGFDVTLDQVAAVIQSYRVRQVLTDQHSAAAILDGLKRRGLTAQVRDWTNASKYNGFTRLKAALSTRTIELPDDQELISELLNLEAAPTPSGLTRIAAAGSGHDDRASVLAALALEMLGRREAVIAAPAGGTQTSRWLNGGDFADYDSINAERSSVNFGAPAVSAVPTGATCPTVDRDGYLCGCEHFKSDGRCIRCDVLHPAAASASGANVPRPPLMLRR
jgi:hypothetical protein